MTQGKELALRMRDYKSQQCQGGFCAVLGVVTIHGNKWKQGGFKENIGEWRQTRGSKNILTKNRFLPRYDDDIP